MVDVTELCFDRFRKLFLTALVLEGVTEIVHFSVRREISRQDAHSHPKDVVYFTAHTNVGVKNYSMSSSEVNRFNALLLDDKAWAGAILSLNAQTEIISVTFRNSEVTTFEVFPQPQMQGPTENV